MKTLVISISLLLSTNVFSTDTLKDITVYGALEAKSYYDDSNSISVLSEEDFKLLKATHFDELIKQIPNLNYSKGSNRSRYFQIRGIGERSAYEGMPNTSVGVVIDDIDYSGIGSISNLTGISQVEVYKGPQATTLGPSALAGMIHMSSNEPTKIHSGSFSFDVGNYNTFEEELIYSGPLSKNLSLSVSANKKDSDGYMENIYLGRKDTNGQDEFSLKTKLVHKSDKNKLTLNAHYFNFDNGYDAFIQNNSFKTESDKPGQDKQNIKAISVKNEYNQFSTTIATYLKSKHHYSYDEDWGNDQKWLSTPGYNATYNYNIEFPKTREDLTIDQRFKFSELLFGGYLKKSDESFKEIGYKDDSERKNIQGGFDTYTSSLYGSYDKDFLSFGLRINNRSADYSDNQGNSFDPNEVMFGGHIALNYKHQNSDLSYAKLSRGFKAGGFNTQSDVPTDRKEFDQETLYSFELGTKRRFDDINLKVDATLFYMYRQDVQVKTSFQDDPMDPSSYTFYTDNATTGHNYGAEFEISFFPLDGLDLITTIGLLQTKYGDYTYGGKNLKGREMPHAPEYQVSQAITYETISGYRTTLNAFFTDNYYFANSHNQKSRAYALFDFILSKEVWKINLSAYIKNIFDTDYATRGFYFSNEPPAWEDTLYTQRGVPRTYGLKASLDF